MAPCLSEGNYIIVHDQYVRLKGLGLVNNTPGIPRKNTETI